MTHYKLNPELKSVTFTVRLPRYLIDWMDDLGLSKSKYLESLVVKHSNLQQPMKFLEVK